MQRRHHMLFSCWQVLLGKFSFASFFRLSAFCSLIKNVFTTSVSSWFDCPSCLFVIVSSPLRSLFFVLPSMLSLPEVKFYVVILKGVGFFPFTTLSQCRVVSASLSKSSFSWNSWSFSGCRICSAHSSNDVQTPLISSGCLNCVIFVICVRNFGDEALEKLMFANGVSLRWLEVVPVYFPKMFQSPFLSFLSSLRKNYCSWRNHVNTIKLKVRLFCWKNFCLVLNWTWLQCPLCTVLMRRTSSILVALLFRSGFFVCMYVKMICKSWDQSFNELFKCVGCNPNVTRTFTNSYPTHDWINLRNSKLWPLSAFPKLKGHLAIEFAIT